MGTLDPYRINLDDEEYLEKVAGLLDHLEPLLDELLAARQGQGSLSLNLARYILASAGLQGALPANGHRITGAADAAADGDYVTLRQLVATAFAPGLPGQAGNARKFIGTSGSAADWRWMFMWDVVDADTNAAPGQALAVRTATASREITLPVAAANVPVYIKDADFNAAVNPIRINPGAAAIENTAPGEVMTISSNGGRCGLQYINNAWRLIS